MGLCLKRIPQKDHKINLSFHDLCTDLLVSAERAAAEAFYRKAGTFRDQTCRCAGSAEEMSFQDLLIFVTPVHQLFFLAVMGDKSDMLRLADFHCYKIVIKHMCYLLSSAGYTSCSIVSNLRDARTPTATVTIIL